MSLTSSLRLQYGWTISGSADYGENRAEENPYSMPMQIIKPTIVNTLQSKHASLIMSCHYLTKIYFVRNNSEIDFLATKETDENSYAKNNFLVIDFCVLHLGLCSRKGRSHSAGTMGDAGPIAGSC
jgi:hypothetical protein